MIFVVVGICILPILMNLAGLDFGAESKPFDNSVLNGLFSNVLSEALYLKLSGGFIHTILEWSAFTIALFTAFIAFAHYRVKRDVITPIIGISLFFAGCMDAFHTLAADKLIAAVASNQDLMPFTWVICRLFYPLIIIIGVSLSLLRKNRQNKTHFFIIPIVSLFLGIFAYLIVHYCAASVTLPQTIFPDSAITRPYDLIPLFLFVVSGIVIFPYYYKMEPTLFSQSLIISVIPNVACQLHMAFGSSVLFDNHFNVAHFLKIVAYLVPFTVLLLDYIRLNKSDLNVAVDGIITIDEKGVVLSFNPAAEKIFLYNSEELIGKNVSILMPNPYSAKHDSYIEHYKETGDKRIIDVGRKVEGLRKDGSIFPLDLAIAELKLKDGIMFTGIVRVIK